MNSNFTYKRIITVATTGAWPTKKNNPNLPMTPSEIAEEIYQCWKAGAAVAHIHVRDDEGRGTMDHRKFEETVGLIRAHKDCDIILNLTTAGEAGAGEERRMEHLRTLRPEMASYDCGSMNMQHAFLADNSPSFLEKLGRTMQETGTKPEIEIFDLGMLYEALYYVKQGILCAPLHFQLVLGTAGGMPATVENLVFLHSKLPEGCTWGAFGVGKQSMPIMLTTIALGGQIRVGMEDNVMLRKGVLARSNVDFVLQAKRLLEGSGCSAATPNEAREILGLTHKVQSEVKAETV